MRFLLFLAAVTAAAQPAAQIQELSHRSQVMAAARAYRVYLPPAYAASRSARYPVIYWFHGYEAENPARDAALSAYVAIHPVIVIDSGPADTTGQFPLYFPELVEHIDKTLRTIPDRDHRAVTGSAAGGFLAIFQAAKSPDLIGSASSFGGTVDAPAGPQDFDVDSSLADLYPTLDAVRIRQVPADSSLAEILDFHLDAFAHPLPRPAVFSHADPYPNFGVWGWEVVSDRRRPAFTTLENVSRSGFRCAVREWIPAGAALPEVKLSITSPPLYRPAVPYTVTYIRLRDGKVRHATQKADARGRLTFDLDGDSYEIGVGPDAGLALSGIEISGAAWAAAGQPVQARLKFWNMGTARSATALLKWESPTPGVKFQTPGVPREQSRARRIHDHSDYLHARSSRHLRRAHRSRGGRSASLDRHTRYPAAPRSPLTRSSTGSPFRPTPARSARAIATDTPPPVKASPSCCPTPARSAPRSSSPTIPVWTTRCASVKPARAFRYPRYAPLRARASHTSAGADRPQLFRSGNPGLVPQSLKLPPSSADTLS